MAIYREAYIFRIETDDPAMIWSGYGPILLPADDILSVPEVALGAGELVSLPELEQLINGLSQRAEITLSGVSDATMALAEDEAAQVPGAAVYIGVATFDRTDWSIESVAWEWAGEGKKLAVSSEDNGGDRVRTLTLTVGAGDTSRQRAPLAFFTAADQQRDFPDDLVFDHVGAINAGTTRRWGPK